MVLTNTLLVGLACLLVCLPLCTPEQQNQKQSAAPETITTSVRTATTVQKKNVTNPTQKPSSASSTSKPKTDDVLITHDKSPEQKNNRGSTKYANYGYTTTETSTISKQSTTVRNDRSLIINTDKYNSPEYRSENNIYSESQIFDKKPTTNNNNKEGVTTPRPWEHHMPEFSIELTTVRNDIFDDKYKRVQEEITRSLDAVLTTVKYDYKDFTTPKNHAFDNQYKKMQEDISKSLDDSVDKFFAENKRHEELDNVEKPQPNDSKLDYARFRRIENMESKDKNKIRKDYNDEIGIRRKISSDYNRTQIIDAPGIVNGVSDPKDNSKKVDLEEDESKAEKITIERPGSFISNKIENDLAMLNSGTTEGPEEKPFEHGSIYNPSSLSTKSEVRPADLTMGNSSEILENNTKSVKKEKVKSFKKELGAASSDIDNKISKFFSSLTTRGNTEIETPSLANLNKTTESPAEIFHEVTTSAVESDTAESTIEDQKTTEEFYERTSEFFEVTDAPGISDVTTTEDTIYTSEMTTDDAEFNVTESTTDVENINTIRPGDSVDALEQEIGITEITTMKTATETSTSIEVGRTSWNITETKFTITWTNTTEYSRSDVEDLPKSTDAVGITKKNETIPKVINEITKPPVNTTTYMVFTEGITTRSPDDNNAPVKSTLENDHTKKNEINNSNTDKISNEDCETIDGDDYSDCKSQNNEEGNESDVEIEDGNNGHAHIQHSSTEDDSKRITSTSTITSSSTPSSISIESISAGTVAITQRNREVDITESDVDTTTKSDSIVGSEDDDDGGNGGKIAAIVISTIGGICLLLLVALLIIMKKRQKRFNYGQRCRPVSLDAYSMDNVSIHNSTRRKGVLMASKRSYGNPAFEDPTSPSHPLNLSELLKFVNNHETIKAEFDKIPQVTTKTNELPEGCDIKNRYANVIPLPETRVFLSPIEGIPSSDYINANYVTGPQGARHYYIACQAPMQNTIEDFWRMIWEQQSKVVLMLTHLYESGVEKCIDYLPPSEVLDCHRLFGDYQVTLKKREVKDKYIISSLQLKNMVSNSWREVTHLWYMGWPEKGVPEEVNSLITFLIEARSCLKIGDNKIKETNNSYISNGLTPNLNPLVVHCSPGTGRTGTVIACDIAVREFELTRKVDIPRIVYRIRRDRASAVQTKEQYAFIYKVINFYAAKLTGGAFDSF